MLASWFASIIQPYISLHCLVLSICGPELTLSLVIAGDAAPFPGELAHACELMLTEGCIPSIQIVLGCLDAMFPIDLIVSTFTKVLLYLVLRLAATNLY